MHLKWPSGHSRLKQGLQTMSIFAIFARGDSGGVYAGDDEPNSATSGTPTAAAACMRPESLLTTTAGERQEVDRGAEVRCAGEVVAAPPASSDAAITASAAGRSFGEPISQTRMPSAMKRVASAAKCSAGQRLAGPYSAPGHSTATGAPPPSPNSRTAAARLAASGTSTGGGDGVDAGGASPASASARSGRRGAAARAGARRRTSVSRPQRDSPTITGADRDPGEPGYERRLPGIRQHERAGITIVGGRSRKLRASARAPAQVEAAVADRVGDDVAHAAHPRVDRAAPGRRQHVDRGIRVHRPQPRDQRLGQDGIADPRGGDDQDALAHGVPAVEPRPAPGAQW